MLGLRGVIILVSLLALACSSPEEEIEEHLERGREYAAEGLLPEATIEFRSALDLDPNRGDVHFELAEAYRALGHEAKALWELEEAVRLDPTHHTAKVYYAQTLSLSNRAEVRERALELAREAVADRPDSVPARLAEARALNSLDRGEEAREAATRAVETDPDHEEAHRLLGWLCERQGDPAAAEREYRAAIDAEASFITWITLAQHLAWQGDRDDEAEKAYVQAIELADHRDSMRGIEGLAGFLISRGRIEEAGALLHERYERHGRAPELLALLARFHSRLGRDDEAEAVIRDAAAASTDAPGPHVTLAAYLEERGDHAGAAAAIAEALRIDPNDPDARLREAYMTVQRGKRSHRPEETSRGRSLLAALIASEPPNQGRALVTRGRIELDDGDHVAAATSIGLALGHGVDDADAHALHGAALLPSDPWRAVAALRLALERDLSSVEVRTLLVDALNRVGEHAQALKVGQPVLAVRPDRAELRLRLADSLVALGRSDDAIALLTAAPEADTNSLLALARLQLRRQDFRAARATIERANRLEPDDARVLGAWLELDVAETRVDESAARLARAGASNPDDGQIAWLSARAALAQGKPEQAKAELRRGIRLAPDHLPAYLDLAMLLTREGRLAEVVGVYEQAVAQNPNASLHFLLGLLQEQQGRSDDAVESYERAIALDDAMAVAKNNLAYLLAERKTELDRALELARAAKRDRPDDPGVADTLGWVYFQRGSYAPAAAYLREAAAGYAAGNPARGIVRYHLAVAEEANGDLAAAKAAAAAALDDAKRLELPADAPPPSWLLDLRRAAERLGEAPAAG